MAVGNEAQKIFVPCFILVGFLETAVFRGFELLKMVIFGDKDNMTERFVEVDARCVGVFT